MFAGYNSMPTPTRTGLLEFIKTSMNCQFVIPIYQRNYTWVANKEVRKFLSDFEDVLSKKNDRHFLGIIVYLGVILTHRHQEFSVVDGQQRLTTTFLTLYALKHLLESSNDPEQQNFALALDDMYLTNRYITEDSAKFKLKPLVSDDNVYLKIVENELSRLSEEEKQSNVYKNYVYIKRRLETLLEEYSYEDIHEALEKLYIVNIPLIPDDNAQQIFESINSTGAPLYSSDLIRNFMLMNMESNRQEELYKKYWHELEVKLKEPTKIEDFFRFYLAVKNYSLPNKKDIYKVFKDWFFAQSIEIEQIFQDVINYATYFYKIYLQPFSDISSEAIKNFRKNKSAMPAPFLMEMFNLLEKGKISKDTFEDIVSLVDTYLIRRWLCGWDTSSITRFFPTLLKDVMDRTNGEYSNILEYVKVYLVNNNKLKSMAMPTDENLRDYLSKNNAYVLECTRNVLDRIEHNNNPAQVDLSKLNVEHILPQTPTEYWQKQVPAGQYDKYVNLIGNLTLAAIPDNSRMHNDDWDRKKQVLSETKHLKLNSELLEYESWNSEKITERTDEIINQIIEIFPYQEAKIEPQKYFVTLKSHGIVATGYLYENETIEILPSSGIANYSENAGKYPELDTLYQDLLDDEIIEETEEGAVFKQPYTFSAISMAASFICRGHRNGWDYFKDENGNDLKDIRKAIQKK